MNPDFNVESSSMSVLTMPITIIVPSSKVSILERFQNAMEAIANMKEHGNRSVLVSDQKNEIIGIVSETDILYKVFSMRKDPSKVKIIDIMSSPIISVPPETAIGECLGIMQSHAIGQVVVVGKDSKIHGVVTRNDIITKIERAAVETVNAFQTDSAACIMNPFASISISGTKHSLICPHCKTTYNDKELLSKHVKAIHAEEVDQSSSVQST